MYNEVAVRMAMAGLIVFVTILSTLTARPLLKKLSSWLVPVGASFLTSILQGVILIGGIYSAAQLIELQPAVILTILATVSLTLTLSLQNSLGETISAGKALAARRFGNGDLVTIGDYGGTVQHVTLFGTILSTITGDTIYLPNSMLDGTAITNHTEGGILQMRVRIPVASGQDHQGARNVVNNAINGNDHVMACLVKLNGDHPGNYLYSKFVEVEGGYAEVIECVFWICEPSAREAAESAIVRSVLRDLSKAGINTT